MDIQQFIAVLKSEVEKSAADNCITQYMSPSGHHPSEQLLQLSAWYRGLNDTDQAKVKIVANDSAHAAVFGFLCVLDGVRAVEDSTDKGRFELWYVNDGKRVLLNAADSNFLHDEYNAI